MNSVCAIAGSQYYSTEYKSWVGYWNILETLLYSTLIQIVHWNCTPWKCAHLWDNSAIAHLRCWVSMETCFTCVPALRKPAHVQNKCAEIMTIDTSSRPRFVLHNHLFTGHKFRARTTTRGIVLFLKVLNTCNNKHHKFKVPSKKSICAFQSSVSVLHVTRWYPARRGRRDSRIP